MATFAAIFSPAGDATGTINAGTASSEIIIGKHQIFAIQATGQVNITFGNSGMAAPTASNWPIQANTVVEYELTTCDRIRLFNNGAGSVTWFIQLLSRT